MIVYSATKLDFCNDVRLNKIDSILFDRTLHKQGRRTAESEVRSWRNSLQFMNNIMLDKGIPDDSNIAIEYKIPGTSFRIDFVISGIDEKEKESVVIVELKQWSKAFKTGKKDVVLVDYGKTNREVPHPSYQAWSYAAQLEDFNTTVQDEQISLRPCAYLHNCETPGDLIDPSYNEYITKAPIFFKSDVEKLASFIKKYIKFGDKNDVLYRIDNGKIRPSKGLADQLASMLKGNQEFVLIDDQKVVYETAIELAKKSSAKNKKVLIVEGGPGSGKSVVAINLLSKFTELEKVAQYVSKNSAPRKVYEYMLTGSFTKTRISNMFKGSGSFTETDRNDFDILIVDEAHRLNRKSGMFSNKGENQIGEIIKSSLLSVFFIDENQKVTFKDIGSKEEIRNWAKKEKAEVIEMKLESQFRCNGSDAYLAWLDNSLQIRDTANTELDSFDYEFKVFDNPSDMKKEIIQKNKLNNKSRIVAGYCWEWPSKKNGAKYDIEIDSFKMRWNLEEHGQAWLIHKKSISEAGCIHTSQGLELDYVGVIIGPDLIVRNDEVVTDATQRAKSDQSIKGFKKMLKENEDVALSEADIVIKNTYRTLMTRGMKGCYVYCTDTETREYFKSLLRNNNEIT